MGSIEQRALSYARMADCRDRREMELAKLDYAAGAKEERILFMEWLERNVPQVVTRFKEDFKVEPTEKYYGDDSRAE